MSFTQSYDYIEFAHISWLILPWSAPNCECSEVILRNITDLTYVDLALGFQPIVSSKLPQYNTIQII